MDSIRVTDLENRENLQINSGWLTAIATGKGGYAITIVMIVLGMIALAQPAAGIAFPFFASVTSALVFG